MTRILVVAMLVALILTITNLPTTNALSASFSCPETLEYSEEFTCTVSVSSVDKTLDIKFYLKGDAGSVNQVYDGSSFRRSDWYIKEFISSDGNYEVKQKIHKDYDGIANGEFKLRDSSGKIVVFETYEVTIGDTQENNEDTLAPEDDEESNSAKEPEKTQQTKEDRVEKEVATANVVHEVSENKKVINLNPKSDNTETRKESVIYKSKTQRVKDIILYAFTGFLVLIVAVLLYERQWRKKYERL